MIASGCLGVAEWKSLGYYSVSPLNKRANCRINSCNSNTVNCGVTKTPSIQTKNKKNPRRPQNVDGDFYVDERCIDCDVCRWMAPDTFKRVDWKSAVYKQPESPKERTAALQALLSCPVKSIRTEKPPSDILKVHSTFPLPIDDKTLPRVYHCGYHSDKSDGATSYFIKHRNGNILVDSPSYKEKLAIEIDALGGLRYIFLTHSGNVADHDKWANRFSCDRIIHIDEVEPHTFAAERKLEGKGPWRLYADVDMIFTPGHTKGSMALLHKPLNALFTGDLVGTAPNGDLTYLGMFDCYSVEQQLESIRALLHLDFVWILPGHGRRVHFESITSKNAAVEKVLSKATFFEFV